MKTKLIKLLYWTMLRLHRGGKLIPSLLNIVLQYYEKNYKPSVLIKRGLDEVAGRDKVYKVKDQFIKNKFNSMVNNKHRKVLLDYYRISKDALVRNKVFIFCVNSIIYILSTMEKKEIEDFYNKLFSQTVEIRAVQDEDFDECLSHYGASQN